MHFIYFLQSKNSSKGIFHQLTSKRTLNALNFFLGKHSDRYMSLVDPDSILNLFSIVNINEVKIGALIGHVAKSFPIDIFEHIGENSIDVGSIFLVIVDDVISFLEHFEEFSYF